MAGIYIHIPFCKQACNYCDFHFSTSLKNKDAFLSALKTEIKFQKNYLGTATISTIYFGGGTPSLLFQNELMDIFSALHTCFNIASDAEITLEANPDNLTKEYIASLKNTPINRLSIGVQSFCEEDLKFMNRAHDSNEALNAIKLSQDGGFENITIDLIYGTPSLTHQHWQNNLQIAFALTIKHISAYCLTVEPKTALAHQIKSGKIKNINEQHGSEQFEILVASMQSNDYIQYEISNFCKEGFHSRHNSNYWLKENYLGLGPSAHSFNGTTRQWNVSNNATYIKFIQNGTLNFESEELSTDQQYNEYILTSLRTIMGTDLNFIDSRFETSYLSHCLKESEKYIRSGHLVNGGNKLFLTDKGKLFADKISSDLFMTK